MPKKRKTGAKKKSDKQKLSQTEISQSQISDKCQKYGINMSEQPDSEYTDEKVYVLVIYTGGTIGMKESPDGYVPKKGYLEELLASYPNFNDPGYPVTDADRDRMICVNGASTQKLEPLPLHKTQDGYRIIYGILEYHPLLDSSNMNMSDWKKIAESIFENYQYFSGFVILHGTDTMAYTASALSFILKNLDKAVVVTGSQVPMAQLRTDAIENFVGALIMAGRYSTVVPEVGLFFHNTLFRGNRTTKVNASGFGAFDSPNLPYLAQIGVNVTINKQLIRSSTSGRFTLHPKMESAVGVFMLFPGITAGTMQSCLSAVKGAVILTFGAGNGPDKNEELMQVFKDASHRGVLMLNITQCLKGEVEAAYATGTALEKAGLLPGGDMTPEAALTKLSYILAMSDLSQEDRKEALVKNLRGEITVETSTVPV